MEEKREFKGVWISREIWLDKRLSILEKGILTEINSLDNEESGCYASNKYLAEFCQCSEASVTKAISKLKQLGFIYEKSFDGRTRILKTSTTNSTTLPSKIYEAECEKIRPNNIYTNNIIDIIDYLNSRAGTKYSYKGKEQVKTITARLKEKFTIDDFKKVIDKKVNEWQGTDMAKYIRPETLFGNKFESYLNQKGTKNVSQKYDSIDYKSMFTDLKNVEI